MDFSVSSIAAGVIFGIFGLYIFRNGKKRSNTMHLLLGIALMVYPYFVPYAWLNWVLGCVGLSLAYMTRYN